MELSPKPNPKAKLNPKPENNNRLLYEVVKPIFIELALALTINITAIIFFAVPLSATLITAALLVPGLISCAHAACAILRNDIKAKDVGNQELRAAQLSSRMALADSVGLALPNLLVHEGGHAFAANLLFRNPQASIWVIPFKGGATGYIISNGPTALGSLLGRRCSLLVIAAAGFMATSALAVIEMLAASRLAGKRPVLAEYLNLHAISNLFNEVIYGLSAFLASEQDIAHDFVNLWYVGGIHPLIPVTTMIALPLLCGGYRFISSALQKAA